MTIRIGLIGAGANTRDRHVPGFRAVEDVEVVSVCNRSRESSEAVARALGIPRVAASVDELLADGELDAVCIGTWPYRHRDYTVAALSAGKHVLCEARMAMDATEATEMLEASRSRPDLVAQLVPAPFDFRLGPTITRLIREGALGDVVEATVTVANGAGLNRDAALSWRHRADYSGHNTMLMGIYAEIVQRWLGDTRRVSASARVVVESRIDPETGERRSIEVPDSLGILAEMASGSRVAYQFSSVAAGAPYNGIVLYGTKATLRWTPDDRATWAAHGQPFADLEPDSGSDRGWRVESDFIASIRDGAPVELTNFADGLKYMRFTDAVWRSWNEGVRADV